MMPVNVKKNNLLAIERALSKAVANTTLAGAAYAEMVAKESMQGPKSGRLYKVSRTGKLHRASAPGQAPAIDTGNLVNSIQHEQVGSEDARVFTHVEYAPYLEFGTARMAPRPFMTPAAIKSAKFLAKRILQEVNKALRPFR
jgi:HK97 gp10 family phage protein